jgi:putative transposase
MQVEVLMIDFKGSHYPKDVVLCAVVSYVRYAVSYRDLEEIMAEHVVGLCRKIYPQFILILY